MNELGFNHTASVYERSICARIRAHRDVADESVLVFTYKAYRGVAADSVLASGDREVFNFFPML